MSEEETALLQLEQFIAESGVASTVDAALLLIERRIESKQEEEKPQEMDGGTKGKGKGGQQEEKEAKEGNKQDENEGKQEEKEGNQQEEGYQPLSNSGTIAQKAFYDGLSGHCVAVSEALLSSRAHRDHAERALAWAQQAMLFSSYHDAAISCQARALEDLEFFAAAVASYEKLAKSPDARYRDEASKALQDHVEEEYLNQDSLRAKKKNAQQEATGVTSGTKLVAKTKVPKGQPLSGLSPVKVIPYQKGDTPIRDAVQTPGALKGNGKQLAEKFLKVFDEEPPPKGDIILRTLRARRGEKLTLVSWNAQLMNKMDGPNDHEIDQAIQTKSRNIAAVVAGAGAALLVVQEAPGEQLRSGKNVGKNARRVARGGEFTAELARSLPSTFECVDLALDDRRGPEEGEDHIVCYDRSVLHLVPHSVAELPVCRGDAPKGWFARPPAVAEFAVRIWGGARLLVCSVHAKAGGSKETNDDIRMIARALVEKRSGAGAGAGAGADAAAATDGSHHPPPAAMLVVGDFNLPTDEVAQLLEEEGLGGFKRAFPAVGTNIWQFNATQEAHSYDSGFFWSSTPGWSVGGKLEGTGAGSQLRQTYEQMLSAAESLVGVREGLSAQLASGSLTPPAELALRSVLDEIAGAKDGVPPWLREKFKKQVKISWSDHMPISVVMGMPPQQA